jgi:hypothetical protein
VIKKNPTRKKLRKHLKTSQRKKRKKSPIRKNLRKKKRNQRRPRKKELQVPLPLLLLLLKMKKIRKKMRIRKKVRKNKELCIYIQVTGSIGKKKGFGINLKLGGKKSEVSFQLERKSPNLLFSLLTRKSKRLKKQKKKN